MYEKTLFIEMGLQNRIIRIKFNLNLIRQLTLKGIAADSNAILSSPNRQTSGKYRSRQK